MSQNTSIEAVYRTNVILWAAFLMSQFLFLVVIFFAKGNLFKFDFTKPVLGDNAVPIIILAFLAIMNLGLSFVLKAPYFQRAADEQNPGLAQTGLILAYAICESISLFGMVIAFAFNYQYFFVWFALAVLGFILHFPKRDTFVAAVYKK